MSQAVRALRRRDAHQHLGRLKAVFRHAGSRVLYHGLALACSEVRQAAPRLESRLACLLMAGQVSAGEMKLGNLAEPLRAMPLQPGWLWPRVEAGRQVCPDLAQTVKGRRPAVAQPASVYLRATVCRQV